MYFRLPPVFWHSQGSVATYLRCGGKFKHEFVANLPLSLSVQKFWKSVNIWGSYGQELSVLFFDSRCIHLQQQQQQPFNGLFSRTTWVSQYQKGKTDLDFTGARDSERQWHHLGHMQVCTSLQTDNHASTPPLCFLQAGCPSCRPTNSVKALKAKALKAKIAIIAVTVYIYTWIKKCTWLVNKI